MVDDRYLTDGAANLFMAYKHLRKEESSTMTSQMLELLSLIGISVGLVWLGVCWIVACGGRLVHTINPLWRRMLHELYMTPLAAHDEQRQEVTE